MSRYVTFITPFPYAILYHVEEGQEKHQAKRLVSFFLSF